MSATDESVEVLKNVWQIRQDLAPVQPGTYTVAQLLVGDQILLIDTGIPGRDGSILRLIHDLCRSPRDVVAILNTHGHADHIGSNVLLAETTGGSVHIHRDDRFYLDAAKQYWGDLQVKTAPAQVLLADGDTLTFGEHRLTVIHLPGHSAGSVGYYDKERRVLYSGDAVQGRGSAVQHLALYYDPNAYERSLRRVRALNIEHLIPSHPYLPLSSSIVSGEAVLDYVDLSLRVCLELDDQIRDVTRKAARPVTVEDIALPLCRQNGFETITSMATITVRAHLERMRRGRSATMKNVGGTLLWDVA